MQLTHPLLALAFLTIALANPIIPQGPGQDPSPAATRDLDERFAPPGAGKRSPAKAFTPNGGGQAAPPAVGVGKREENFSRFSPFPTNTRPTSKHTVKPTGIIPTGHSKRAIVSVPTGPPRFSVIPTATPKFPNTTISVSTKSKKNDFTILDERAIFGTAPTITGTGKFTIKPTKPPKPTNGTVTATSSISKSSKAGRAVIPTFVAEEEEEEE